jgi:hypothetical protein
MESLLDDVVGARSISLSSEGVEPHAPVPSSPLCLARRCPQPRWRRCPCALVAAREGRKGAVREGRGTQRPRELRPSLALQERRLFASDESYERGVLVPESLAHRWTLQIKHGNLQLESASHHSSRYQTRPWELLTPCARIRKPLVSLLHPQPMRIGAHHPSTYENGFCTPELSKTRQITP